MFALETTPEPDLASDGQHFASGSKPSEKDKEERRVYFSRLIERKPGQRVPLPHRLAKILGEGNEAGYEDHSNGVPARRFSASDDPVFVMGYKSGYESAAEGKRPRMIQLKQDYPEVYKQVKSIEASMHKQYDY